MQTAEEMIQRARNAAARGDITSAEAFKERAAAIQAGPAALARFEQMAESRMEIPAFIRRERAAQEQDARIDKALTKAGKLVGVDELGSYAAKLADELHEGGNYMQLAYDKAKAFSRYLKGVPEERIGPIMHTPVLSPRQLEEAIRDGWSAAEIKAIMVESQSGLGGFLTSESLREQILGRATTLSVVRSRATIDVPGPGGSIGFPVWQGAGDIYSTALRGVWSSELQAGNAEVATLGKISPPIKLWRLKLQVTKSLLEDAGPALVPQITKRIGEAASVEEDRQELTGTGADGPLGILAQQSAGVLLNKDVRVTNSGSVASITADAVIRMFYSLPQQYRDAPGFCSTCNSDTTQVLRLLKDGAGRYLFNEDYGTLCGKPLVESESMPDVAANAYPLLSGDFSGYYIGDRLGLSVQLYQDSNVADQDMAVIYVRRRVGGTPGEGYRFAALKVSA